MTDADARAGWLDALPGLVATLLDDWELRADGEPVQGSSSFVVPVLADGRRPCVVKVAYPRPDVEHEALALKLWHGRGAVRLVSADPHRSALLLERLEPTDLRDAWDLDACATVAGLYQQLHVPAPVQLPRLSTVAAGWASALSTARGLPVPPRLVQEAASLARDLAKDEATDGVTVHTDLHFGNVLRSPEGERLAIAPKPLSGDPHSELAPMLWHRLDAYAGRFREGVRDRFFALVDGAELDEDRARSWAVVRLMVRVLEEVRDNPAVDRAWVTGMLSVAKAVRD